MRRATPLLLLVAACRQPDPPPIGDSFTDGFDRAEIGSDYRATADVYRIKDGALNVQNGYNHPLWLRKKLPDDAITEDWQSIGARLRLNGCITALTRTGDVTVHCSDTLHRAYPPVERPRTVVYSSFSLPARPGDDVRPDPDGRAARARLSDVQSRIEAADNAASPQRYRAGRGR